MAFQEIQAELQIDTSHSVRRVGNEFSTLEEDSNALRALLMQALSRLDNAESEDGESSRAIQRAYAQERIKQDLAWIAANWRKYNQYFASGDELVPENIRPVLWEVDTHFKTVLFRLARYTWSMPYSRGYGRRMRFIVFDEAHKKLIGIIGFQSPPIDFSVRDRLFQYPPGRKVELINQTMDVFTLGAVPPYSMLLGGKLVALAAATQEVVQAYQRIYAGRRTQIEQRVLPSALVALTTTSAFGRSSLYNRLKYHNRLVARSIGYTQGYGSFHLSEVYPAVKAYLEKYSKLRHGFGNGPRAVWSNCKLAMQMVGIDPERLKHGFRREVFLFPLIANLEAYMSGMTHYPDYYDMSFNEAVSWWRMRWLPSRLAYWESQGHSWRTWHRCELERTLLLKG